MTWQFLCCFCCSCYEHVRFAVPIVLLYYCIYNTVVDIKYSFCALLQACRVAVLATETANLTTFDL